MSGFKSRIMSGFKSRIMSGFKSRIKKLIFYPYFRQDFQERKCRQEFFYNAFKALSFNGIDGDYAEFGCCGGMTFALAYYESRRHGHKARMWAFDSFQGLPAPQGTEDEHPVWVERSMATTLEQFHAICAANGIRRDAYTAVSGFYDQTLATMSPTDAPENIALAYIDCDLYSSTKTVLEFLKPRMKHGMIIAFDDYFCYSVSNISGERKAMLEFFTNYGRWALVPYMQFGWHGNSFVVEDKRLVDQRFS
jgi:hypothetical protein